MVEKWQGDSYIPQCLCPINQRSDDKNSHGKSVHESVEIIQIVGSGYWDHWKNNREFSGSVGNKLKEAVLNLQRKMEEF
jgi:hypothetical protein